MRNKGITLFSLLFILSSCAKKKEPEPYYLFHIGRDAIITDSTGKALRDTFYLRINLGYSYEEIKGMDTVFVPRYVTTVDWSRGLQIKMFAGMTAINPDDLSLIMNFSPEKLTYMKGNFQVRAEEFVSMYKIRDGYVIFTTMNIYHIDFQGHQKKMLEIFTSKKYYGFSIDKVYKIMPEKFLILCDRGFGIYNANNDSLIVIQPGRRTAPSFYINGRIYRLEMTISGHFRGKYTLFSYDYDGTPVDSINMPMFNGQYRIRPYIFGNHLYVLTEKALYHLNPDDFSLIKKIDLETDYDTLWNVGDDFILYSRKKNQIIRIPHDLSKVVIIKDNANCENIYVSPYLISCRSGDTTRIYNLSFKPVITLENVLFVKGPFIGTREGDTLTIYYKQDTFFRIVSPYYSHQRKLQEKEKKTRSKQ